VLATINLTNVLVALIGGGFVTSIGALLKWRPEKDGLIVTSAGKVVGMQSEFLDDLRDELKASKAEILSLGQRVESMQTRFDGLREERDALHAELQEVKADNARLRSRVEQLERGSTST
jgi:uncharacterized coiled-coil DUF342 family protein